MVSNVPEPDSRGYIDATASVRISVEALVDGSVRVFVWGEVDLATAPQFERVLSDAIEDTDSDVLVEFSSHSFIDSTGISVLIQAARRLRESGRALRVTTANAHMRSVIETVGLAEILGL